jgi:hypothetical protein
VSKEMLAGYQSLLQPKSWIYCEKEIATIDSFVFKNWQERLFFERLERKSIPIQQLLDATENDWEAVLFCMLAKNFGLNTNGESFLKIAKSIPFSIIRKEGFEVANLEALFFGFAELFPENLEDTYSRDIKSRFDYILHKYQLEKVIIPPVQFFKHRPDNFPTIRLAQLAMLYHLQRNLFSQIIVAKNLADFYELFGGIISEYWQTHYQLDKESPRKRKQFSKSFVDLLIINTIVPIQFSYAKSQGKEVSEGILALLQEVSPEKNVVIEKFNAFGVASTSAFATQSLLQLKNEYCNFSKCLQCAIGIQLLKQ